MRNTLSGTGMLISKPPDSVYCILQTNSFPCFLMYLLLPAPCTIYCERLNFLLKILALQQHWSSDLLLAAVFASCDWTLGDLCIQPSPINPELLPKVTLMNIGIILWCRTGRRRWGTPRLWISCRHLFFLLFFFFYECNIWPIAVTYRASMPDDSHSDRQQ